MNTESVIPVLEKSITDLLEAEHDIFLVEIKVKPTNNVKVFVDADKGVSIDRLSRLNRALYKEIEALGIFPAGGFSLEVSSPGLDEPLKLYRQYVKNTGRWVEVLQKDGTKIEGKLVSVAENEILVEEEKGSGKHKETVQRNILFENIKSTKIQIKF